MELRRGRLPRNARPKKNLQFEFKLAETAFEFPLLRRFFAGLQESSARPRGLVISQRVFRASRYDRREVVGRAPQAFAGEKTVLDACAHDLLYIAVVESIRLHCSHIFVSQVDARDAFVVGRRRDRHAELAIQRKGMIFSAYAED